MVARVIKRDKLIKLLQKDEYVEAYGIEALVKIFEDNFESWALIKEVAT
jgi:hypothetical protein